MFSFFKWVDIEVDGIIGGSVFEIICYNFFYKVDDLFDIFGYMC